MWVLLGYGHDQVNNAYKYMYFRVSEILRAFEGFMFFP